MPAGAFRPKAGSNIARTRVERLRAGIAERMVGDVQRETAMRAFSIVLLAFPGLAFAQGTTILTPSEPPTYVVPQPGGGTAILTPGQPPTYITTPQQGWGSAIVTPGQPPTYIVPNSVGGAAILGPGQSPTY